MLQRNKLVPLLLITCLLVLWNFTTKFKLNQKVTTNHNQTSLEIKLDIDKAGQNNRSILLAVGILNRITLKQRRDVIRITWMKLCKSEQYKHQARCYFFTDLTKSKDKAKRAIEENDEHNDMLFMPIKGDLIYLSLRNSQLRA